MSVLDRRYFRYMGFGIWFNPALTINLPWLDVCIGVEGKGSSMQNTDILPCLINYELCNVYN